MDERPRVENAVKEVYEYNSPTKTLYSSEEARKEYEDQWKQLFNSLGFPAAGFNGLDLLDSGCGSCEKASFYYDWGARATGLDMTQRAC